MPLAVPGINSSLGDNNEWAQKLVGKKISESSGDVNVLLPSLYLNWGQLYHIWRVLTNTYPDIRQKGSPWESSDPESWWSSNHGLQAWPVGGDVRFETGQLADMIGFR